MVLNIKDNCACTYLGNTGSNRNASRGCSLNRIEFLGQFLLLGDVASGNTSALHAESPGFDSPHLHAHFEWSRVRFTLGALTSVGTYSSEVERSIAEMLWFLSH